MSEVIFIYNDINTIILCSGDEKMKEICLKYCFKIQKDINNLIFLYGGTKINLDLTFNQICSQIDKQRKKINILVYNKNSTIIQNPNSNIKEPKDIVCPQCGEICRIKFENYKIKFFDCKNNHKNYKLL